MGANLKPVTTVAHIVGTMETGRREGDSLATA